MANTRKKKLRTGFTTGAAASAAVKGALLLLFEKKASKSVQITFLTGERVDIPVHACRRLAENIAECSIIKDAGDDPDVTHRAEICAKVVLLDKDCYDSKDILITAGKGVGKITKPGLEVPPGEPAINPGPRKMICNAVRDIFKKKSLCLPVLIEISVPDGEMLAARTLNSRLGILGGISILGTTGMVRPMSCNAYVATIKSSISVAKASGQKTVVFTTGRRSEKYAQSLLRYLPEESFIQIGDFFKISVEEASKNQFKRLILAVFFGKAAKMAVKVPHTHAAKSALTLNRLAKWAKKVTDNITLSKKILSANTARHAFDLIVDDYPEVISYVAKRVVDAAKSFTDTNADISIQCIIFDYDGDVVFRSVQDLGDKKII